VKARTLLRGLGGRFSWSAACSIRFTLKLGKRTVGTARGKLKRRG
jgi:hypothetical protein